MGMLLRRHRDRHESDGQVEEESTPSKSWKVADLKAYAKSNDVDITGATTKADILKAIKADAKAKADAAAKVIADAQAAADAAADAQDDDQTDDQGDGQQESGEGSSADATDDGTTPPADHPQE